MIFVLFCWTEDLPVWKSVYRNDIYFFFACLFIYYIYSLFFYTFLTHFRSTFFFQYPLKEIPENQRFWILSVKICGKNIWQNDVLGICFLGIFLKLNPFVPNPPFLYPLKSSENRFLMFSGGRKRVHWEQMD